MSKEIIISLPKLGESIVSAVVVRWFKKVGDLVALDEPLLEVSTDKVNSEIPSPSAGMIKEIFVGEDQEVQVGSPLAVLSTDASFASDERAQEKEIEQIKKPTEGAEDILSPAVLRLMREHNLSMDDLKRIPRTGLGGRLTKKDVEGFVLKPKDPICPLEGTERVVMTSLRKAISQSMSLAQREVPDASLMTEVDVTDVMALVKREKEAFFKRTGAKLSVTSFVARAIAKAVKEYPLVNASLDGDAIIMKKSVNLGMAVSVDQGVMVPVIRSADSLSIEDLSKEIASLALKARDQTLDPQDVKGGSITMSNFGMTGTMIGLPIIKHPEVAILALGVVKKQPKVMKDDSIQVRQMMWVTLTFDHRVIDGIYGCSFLNQVKENLETNFQI